MPQTGACGMVLDFLHIHTAPSPSAHIDSDLFLRHHPDGLANFIRAVTHRI